MELSEIEVGIEVKIAKGPNRGKQGKIIKKRPTHNLQQGKIPVMVGNRNQVIWVRHNWLENRENFSNSMSEYMGKNREGICQSQQSDCLKASEDSVEQQNSAEESNGSSQLKSMTMPSPSYENTSSMTSGMETSETMPPIEESIYTVLDSHVLEHQTPESEPDSTTQNQPYGLKHLDASLKASQDSLSWSNLKELSTEDFEQCLEASEWQDILGTIRSSSKARKLELSNIAPDYLSSPTLTASSGKTSRPAGQTKCEKWLKDKEIIPKEQVLSAAGMALLSGFPMTWTDCLLLSAPRKKNIGLDPDTFTEEPSFPPKQSSPSNESSTSIPVLTGLQWIEPGIILLKEGTQPRDCDEAFAGETTKIQQYAEDMKSGIWNFEEQPLPVAFVDSAGKIHASDCHHRVSAAIAAGIDKILIDLRPGELVDAKLFAVQANTQHGLPLRPKDQRKRIEMFLDLLEIIDEERAEALLYAIPNLGKAQKENSLNLLAGDGRWTARTVAKYLKLNESGYRTVQNIMLERRRVTAMKGFNVDDFTCVTGGDFDWEGKIQCFDKRKGVFVIPLPWSIGNDGRMLASQWVEPWDLRPVSQSEADKLSAAIERSNQRENREKAEPAFTSVKGELKHKAKELGVPEELPDMERNEGDPTTLVDIASMPDNKTVVQMFKTAISLLPIVEQLSDREILKLWNVIAPRVEAMGDKHCA